MSEREDLIELIVGMSEAWSESYIAPMNIAKAVDSYLSRRDPRCCDKCSKPMVGRFTPNRTPVPSAVELLEKRVSGLESEVGLLLEERSKPVREKSAREVQDSGASDAFAAIHREWPNATTWDDLRDLDWAWVVTRAEEYKLRGELDAERGPKVEGEPFAPKVYTRDVYDQYPIHDQICEAVASWKEDYCTVPNVLRLGFMDYAELRKYVGCGLKTKIKEYMGMQVVGTKLIYEICALCEDRSEETDPSCERGSM